ncbi:hypothetical protein [Methylobacterium nonmethylotrophicum]|uniref:Uncharacterized protein n=1 Tax=Methylobacterium nonmethylotrophicum TaxID=1141884 RepID=A0A4Z0NLP2_9HYPH|nr:hypothetical protein [Methylobacterium nonmethylotrophicum]TGD97184.1 hypothetical protein EU555_20700 [Methylobacterium nonmethylotrophicum]
MTPPTRPAAASPEPTRRRRLARNDARQRRDAAPRPRRGGGRAGDAALAATRGIGDTGPWPAVPALLAARGLGQALLDPRPRTGTLEAAR